LIRTETAQLAMAVVGLSMVLTPVLDWIGRKLPAGAEPSDSHLPPELGDQPDFVLIAGFGRVGQTVAKSLSEVGIAFIALDKNPAHVEACRNLGLPIYFGDAARPGVLEKAGAARARAVVIALDREKDSNAAVAALRNSGMDTPIVARSQDLSHRRDLEQKGANAVVPDTVEASLRLGEVVLETLNISEDDSREALNRLRSDDYALLENLVRNVSGPER
ncbi:MAG: NAD-binding protein, partial [Gammaproteobacteria bacterium]